ncbi:TM2 domain-containing protein [Deinococcus sp.]|uniref:TM2 domain-containing protein n=1 Tax=Deinococcus sp. TaxID=47478 RepID=UPI003C7B7437
MTDDSNRQPFVPSSTSPEAVSLNKPGPTGNPVQEGGASPWQDAQAAASSAGNAARDAFQGGVNSFQTQSDVAQKKLVAGLLGIFLGSLGIHKFYLGLNQPGIIMLACTVGGWLLFTLLAIILIGFVFVLLPAAMGIIGLVEGIIYLTKTDADFQREYVVGKKPWF